MNPLDQLLAQLGDETGLSDLRLDENSICSLVFDGTLRFDIEFKESSNERTRFLFWRTS